MHFLSSALSWGKAVCCRQALGVHVPVLSPPQGVVVMDSPGAEYISEQFVESKPGYVFKNGEQGLGFYKDRDRPAPGTQGGYAQSVAARVEGTLRALSGGISNGSSVVIRGQCEPPDLVVGSVATCCQSGYRAREIIFDSGKAG
jgi:hypothetical protein